MFMITLSADFSNPISQIFYDNLLSTIQFHQLSCSCGLSGCLNIHGYYTRRIMSGLQTIPLRICRVKCSICGRTHALLPSSLVPYSQVSLPDMAEIIAARESGRAPRTILERTPSIDENLASCILRRYRHHWHQRLCSESIPLMPLPQLVQRCFRAFGRQFLQIKCTPNLLFLNTT